MKIPVDKIVVPDVRASSQLTAEQQAFFEGTVEKFGVLQDILVRPLDDGRYELIAGKTRLDDQQGRGALEVEAKVIEADTKNALLMHLAENFARGSVEPISTARVIQKTLDEGSTEEEIAKIFNHKPEWVRFMVGLLELSPGYQQALRNRRILVTHVREALRLPDLKEADAALSAAVTHGWNTSVMHNYVNNRLIEFEAAAAASEKRGVTVPPPPPEPERLVKYAQCMVHGGMVPREQIHLPAVCSGCYELAKYVVTQCGTGDQGMQRIYAALELQQAWEAHRRQFLLQKEIGTQPPQTPSSTAPQGPGLALPERPIVIPDDKLRAQIKRILREESERQGT